jgi:hypothetical protein
VGLFLSTTIGTHKKLNMKEEQFCFPFFAILIALTVHTATASTEIGANFIRRMRMSRGLEFLVLAVQASECLKWFFFTNGASM